MRILLSRSTLASSVQVHFEAEALGSEMDEEWDVTQRKLERCRKAIAMEDQGRKLVQHAILRYGDEYETSFAKISKDDTNTEMTGEEEEEEEADTGEENDPFTPSPEEIAWEEEERTIATELEIDDTCAWRSIFFTDKQSETENTVDNQRRSLSLYVPLNTPPRSLPSGFDVEHGIVELVIELLCLMAHAGLSTSRLLSFLSLIFTLISFFHPSFSSLL